MKKAAILNIGDELLMGVVENSNGFFIIKKLLERGIDTGEVRIIGDDIDQIVKSIKELRDKYDYVIATGGIGPTHDDITTEAIAKAFGQKLVQNDEMVKIISKFNSDEVDINAKMRMSYIPENAFVIKGDNDDIVFFRVENIFVLAGSPLLCKKMLDYALPLMEIGQKTYKKSIKKHISESLIAEDLRKIAIKYHHKKEAAKIGSYPFYDKKTNKKGVEIIIYSKDLILLENIYLDIAKLLCDNS